jgi:hypothetical protein
MLPRIKLIPEKIRTMIEPAITLPLSAEYIIHVPMRRKRIIPLPTPIIILLMMLGIYGMEDITNTTVRPLKARRIVPISDNINATLSFSNNLFSSKRFDSCFDPTITNFLYYFLIEKFFFKMLC